MFILLSQILTNLFFNNENTTQISFLLENNNEYYEVFIKGTF